MTLNVGLRICFYGNCCIVKYDILHYYGFRDMIITPTFFLNFLKSFLNTPEFGKSKYGGPFTTEQVEDVKTIFRLLAISLPISLISFSISGHIVAIGGLGETIPGLKVTSCPLRVLSHFIYIPSLYSILGTFGQEFLLYPFFSNRIPTILKRIGIGMFLFTLVCFLCFVLHLSRYLAHPNA